VNKVYSDNTQLQYAYYDLPYVCPPAGVHHAGASLLSGQTIPLNLGEVLRGDRITQSDIELVMGQETECNFLCTKTVSRKDLKRAREMVKDGYVAEWIVDNLPVSRTSPQHERGRCTDTCVGSYEFCNGRQV
jgi:transmembrane 9 superfamily protein 2/4